MSDSSKTETHAVEQEVQAQGVWQNHNESVTEDEDVEAHYGKLASNDNETVEEDETVEAHAGKLASNDNETVEED
jgi:hypothetical protein